MEQNILGIDVGGSGIKAAPVDVSSGTLLADRFRIETPDPATPEAVAKVVRELVDHFNWQGKPIGCGFPAIVKNGIVLSAAHIDKTWLTTDVHKLFEATTNSKVFVLNDADAAGIAEMYYGAGKDSLNLGTVLLLTLGTGIGSALFVDGKLLPNTELGHLDFIDSKKEKHKDVEKWVAASVKEKKDLSWKEWGKRLNAYLNYLNMLFSPDLIIIGGGVSKKSSKFFEFLKVENKIGIETKLVAAASLNQAGIIGAALAAQQKFSPS